MKRFIALVLSLIMALSLCAPAWGAEAEVAPEAPVATTLPKGVTAENFGANTVTDGTTYYATLQTAVEAIATAKTSGATLYCKPGADVGSLQHAPVIATLTVYGNGAYVSGGSERDFDISNTDPSYGGDLTADMTLTVYDLNGCGAWGAKATEHTVNLVFNGCMNMGKVFLTGTAGTLNITMSDCSFEGVISEALYSNANGKIELTRVAFSHLNKAINLNHKVAGTQTVTLTDCSFTNCGKDVSSDQIPVRVLSSVKDGVSSLTVSGCTFSGTPEGGADILLDYGVGTTTASVSGTAANVAVEYESNVATKKAVAATENVDLKNYKAVAEVNGVEFKTLAEAVAKGGEVKLLADVTLTAEVTLVDGVTLDGKGFTIAVDDSVVADNSKWVWKDQWEQETKHLMEFGNNTTVKNVVFDSKNTTFGVQAYCKTGVKLENVTTKNSAGAGLTVNGADVTAVNLVASGNNWGDINVDPGANVTSKSKLAISGDKTVLAGGKYAAIWGTGDKVSSDANNIEIVVSGGNYTGAMYLPAEAGSLTISGGYFTVDPSDYCANKLTGVASDKAGYLYMVGEKKATAAEVDVAKPVVSADKVDTTNTTVENVVNTIGGTSGVEIDDAALTAAAVGAANENKVTPTVQQAEALDDLITGEEVTVNDVAIVVQTYFDVEIEEVKVDDTTNKTTSITVDITPMQQTVATIGDVVDSNTDIKVGENAVKVGNPAPVKITEPVDITLKLPSTCFAVGDKVYITHKASAGTVIYEATVAADYTITFTTTHGFSPFTISASDPGVKASVGTDNYADLQSAINYAGKNAEITVKVKDQSAVVSGEFSFTLKYEGEAKKENTTITAAPGYKVSGPDANGVYTVTKVTSGGYYPYYPPTTTPDSDLVKSPDTFDAGVALYVAVSVIGAVGTVALGKKRED